MIVYYIPENVRVNKLQNRPVLSTQEGGLVAIDTTLLSLWQYANGKDLSAILAGFQTPEAYPDLTRAGLACLAEAGLLKRSQEVKGSSSKALTGALVSVVIVAYNSREWLGECLPSLSVQTYSPIEVVIVDNGSVDDSTSWVQALFPKVRLVRQEEVVTFARATNLGVAVAKGDFFLLLNPDVKLEDDAVAQLVETAQTNPVCAAVAAKLKFWWAPAFLNGLGNRVGAFSWGTDNGLGHLDLGQFDNWEELPSACYAATMISRDAWENVGPADEGFPMYYEDSEWSYRARLLGYKVYAAPKSVVYHAFGGRVPGGQASNLSATKLTNVVYGRLRFSIKLLDRYLGRFLRNYFIEDGTNLLRYLLHGNWAMSRAYLRGWYKLGNDLPRILAERKSLRPRRVISDKSLFDLQNDMPVTLAWNGLPELTWDIIQSHYLPLMLSRRTRPMTEFDPSERRPHLLIVSHDVVDVNMAGPGMRYLEMARALNSDLDVTLAIPSETTLEIANLRMVRYWEDRPESLQVLVENCDVVLISGYLVEKFPFLANTRARLVVDLYDPFVLENLHYYLNEPIQAQESLNNTAIGITNHLGKIGDFFICGNERQRDYWMGVLTANGRTNPRNFIKDPTLRNLIDIVGIGFPSREPRQRSFLRGIHPQVPPESRIVLWGGGIWNWLDPITLVQAWPQVINQHPEARLVFLGTRHPNPLVPRHEMAEKTEKIAAEIGEKDHSIIFFEWLSYEDRESLLCEADIGVTLHPIHVETRFSLRTRVLDYLWARLPVLITEGDITSEWVRQYGLGEVVPPHDVNSVARSLSAILDRSKESWSPSFDPLRESLHWSEVVTPLLQYCREGNYAPDRQDRGLLQEIPDPPGLKAGFTRARYILRTEGIGTLLHRSWRYLQWRLSRT
jgi:GT2 family glycosyltransferase